MPDPANWPELPDIGANDPQADVKKALFQGKLDVCKLERQNEIDAAKLDRQEEVDREKAFSDNEYKLSQAIHGAYLEVAKGQLDRAASSAEFVQKAAAAIATIYSSVIGLSFAVSQTVKALPATGIAPAFFLGLSMVLATAFRAYLTSPAGVAEEVDNGLIPDHQRARRNTFIKWVRSGPLARQYSLQAAVVSLGVGVGLLPLPYLQASNQWLWVIPAGIVVTFGLPVLIDRAPQWWEQIKSILV